LRRVLIDTSIYVDWFRARRHEQIVAGRHGPPSLSAVVAMELLAGARPHEHLTAWTASFAQRGRLLVPGWQVWKLAARVLRGLRARGASVAALSNDVLIAMTARAGGFRLFTANREDFERIAEVEPFDLVVVKS
jgi:predicted nucleic acid-binding protein